MPNKNLLLMLLTLTISSCSSIKMAENATSLTPKEPQKVVVALEKEDKSEEKKMFSISAGELKRSESGPHVIYFDTNSANLDDKAILVLSQKVLTEAKSSQTKKVVIEAHCDERGSKSYNQTLSNKRAKSVKNYLSSNGVENFKIKTVGYGESKPIDLGHNEEAWAKNRRAVTISIKK